jgi:hypothetical protein
MTFFNTFNEVQSDAVEAGLWPKDDIKAGRLAQSLLLRLDRAMDVGLWDPISEPMRSREEYGEGVKNAFALFRESLGEIITGPKGTRSFANSKFSPEDIDRFEKQVADKLFQRRLPPAHVAILIERAKRMGEEIQKAAQYGKDNFFNDPEISLIGRGIQQPDPVTLLVVADKAYPDSVFSLDLADILSQLLDNNDGKGAVSLKAKRKAIDMMNHASDQWAKTLRSAMLLGLREYLPKNRPKTPISAPAEQTPDTVSAVVPIDAPPATNTNEESPKPLAFEKGSVVFSLGSAPLFMGVFAFLSPIKNWSKWTIPLIVLVLMINPLMALAVTGVDPSSFVGVLSGLANVLSGPASVSATLVESVLDNSGAISLLFFAGAVLVGVFQGMKDPIKSLIEKIKFLGASLYGVSDFDVAVFKANYDGKDLPLNGFLTKAGVNLAKLETMTEAQFVKAANMFISIQNSPNLNTDENPSAENIQRQATRQERVRKKEQLAQVLPAGVVKIYKFRQRVLPIVLGVLVVVGIVVVFGVGSSLIENFGSLNLETIQGWISAHFSLNAVNAEPLIPFVGNTIAIHEWWLFSYMTSVADLLGPIFAGWIVSFGLSILFGLLSGSQVLGRFSSSPEEAKEPVPNEAESRASSIAGGVTVPKADVINRGVAVMSFLLLLPIVMAAAFGPMAVISGPVANLIIFAFSISLGVALLNTWRDYTRREKVKKRSR